MLKIPVSSDVEFVILGFLDVTNFYSLFTGQLLTSELNKHLIPDLSRLVVDFTRERKQLYWHKFSGKVVYTPTDVENQVSTPDDVENQVSTKSEGIARMARLTYWGPDIHLGNNTPEEKRLFGRTSVVFKKVKALRTAKEVKKFLSKDSLTFQDAF